MDIFRYIQTLCILSIWNTKTRVSHFSLSEICVNYSFLVREPRDFFFLLACQRSLYFTQGSNVMSSIAAHHAILLALFSGLYKAAAKRQL